MSDPRTEELASLYALDLLEGEDAAVFEKRLQTEPELVQLVREMEESLADTAMQVPQITPPEGIFSKIQDAIREDTFTAASVGGQTAVEPGATEAPEESREATKVATTNDETVSIPFPVHQAPGNPDTDGSATGKRPFARTIDGLVREIAQIPAAWPLAACFVMALALIVLVVDKIVNRHEFPANPSNLPAMAGDDNSAAANLELDDEAVSDLVREKETLEALVASKDRRIAALQETVEKINDGIMPEAARLGGIPDAVWERALAYVERFNDESGGAARLLVVPLKDPTIGSDGKPTFYTPSTIPNGDGSSIPIAASMDQGNGESPFSVLSSPMGPVMDASTKSLSSVSRNLLAEALETAYMTPMPLYGTAASNASTGPVSDRPIAAPAATSRFTASSHSSDLVMSGTIPAGELETGDVPAINATATLSMNDTGSEVASTHGFTADADASLSGEDVMVSGEGLDEPHHYAQGFSIWDDISQEGTLSVQNLPELDDASNYQLWVIDPTDGTPVGVRTLPELKTGSGRITYTVDGDDIYPSGFFITREPARGSTQPTGEIILQGP